MAYISQQKNNGNKVDPSVSQQQLSSPTLATGDHGRGIQLMAMQSMMQASPQAKAQEVMQHRINNSAVTQQKVMQQKNVQRMDKAVKAPTAQLAAKPNNTGLPDQLKTGIESLSGMSMDHVRVHYNSDKPAQLNAHAYAQGSEIHVAAGQEKHLPHEAWHVVQQAQGRVKPTQQLKGNVPVNDDSGLESEADMMGARAVSYTAQLMYEPEGRQSITPFQCKSAIVQRAKITAAAPSDSDLAVKSVRNNWVHFNIQMSGDSRMAIAGVKLANQNEGRSTVYSGLIVSVPKDTDAGTKTPVDYVDGRLNGLLSTHGVKSKTKVYATTADNPHESRTESLGSWGHNKPGQKLYFYQTGKIEQLIDFYENSPIRGAKSLKDTLASDYGKDRAETALGRKLKALNAAGNAVLWFKGDPAEAGAINSLQTAKTEHWLSAGVGNKIIANIAEGKKFAIAGTLTGSMVTALGDKLTADNRFTTDKLTEAGYNNLGKQYGFFNQYSAKMTHFGGRSGHLEPIASMGIKTVYFEEAGNGQSSRSVGIGKDNKMSKVVINGVGGLGGVVSKALSWMKPNGDYYDGERGPSDEQKTLMDNIVAQWLATDDAVEKSTRKQFYETFVAKTGEHAHKQDKDKSLAKNSEHYRNKLAELGHDNLSALEEGVVSEDDISEIVSKF